MEWAFGKYNPDVTSPASIESPEKSILEIIKNYHRPKGNLFHVYVNWDKESPAVNKALLQSNGSSALVSSKCSITNIFEFLHGLDLEVGTFKVNNPEVDSKPDENMQLGNVLHMIPSAILELLQNPNNSDLIISRSTFELTLPLYFQTQISTESKPIHTNTTEEIESAWDQIGDPKAYDGIDRLSVQVYLDSLDQEDQSAIQKRIKILIILIRKLGEAFPASNYDLMIQIREVVGKYIDRVFRAIDVILSYFENDLDFINPLLADSESEVPVDLKVTFPNRSGKDYWFSQLNQLGAISTVINTRQDMIVSTANGSVIIDFKSHHRSDMPTHIFQAKMYILVQACRMMRRSKQSEEGRVFVRDVLLFDEFERIELLKYIERVRFAFLDLTTGEAEEVRLTEKELDELSQLLFQYVQFKIAYKQSYSI